MGRLCVSSRLQRACPTPPSPLAPPAPPTDSPTSSAYPRSSPAPSTASCTATRASAACRTSRSASATSGCSTTSASTRESLAPPLASPHVRVKCRSVSLARGTACGAGQRHLRDTSVGVLYGVAHASSCAAIRRLMFFLLCDSCPQVCPLRALLRGQGALLRSAGRCGGFHETPLSRPLLSMHTDTCQGRPVAPLRERNSVVLFSLAAGPCKLMSYKIRDAVQSQYGPKGAKFLPFNPRFGFLPPLPLPPETRTFPSPQSTTSRSLCT